MAEWFIRIGGVMVIVSVVWILVMISQVSLPLFYPPKADISSSITLTPQLRGSGIIATGVDDSRQQIFLLNETGKFDFIDAASGQLLQSLAAPAVPANASKLLAAELCGKSTYNLLWNNGAISSVTLAFNASRDSSGKTIVTPELSVNEDLAFPGNGPVADSFARRIEGKGSVRIDRLPDGSFRIFSRLVEKDIQGNEKSSSSTTSIGDKLPGPVTAAILDQKGHYLYAGTGNGWLLRWDVSDPGNPRLIDSIAATGGPAVTALNMVLGDFSVAVGDAGGGYATWFPVTAAGSGEDKRLTRIHALPRRQGGVQTIVPSQRNRTLVSRDSSGEIRIDHTTSERTLIELPKSGSPVRLMAFSPQGQALSVLEESGQYTVWRIEIPHPEISLGTLFGKVWYEGYDKPEYAWQSSAANDDFEPKMSLVPLLFGTIKATAFAMLFAVPLALFGALYTSQFMTPGIKSRIKPAVEIMAAIPSVVVGFLAGLWLAPMVDSSILTLFLTFLIVPALLIGSMLFWRLVPPSSPLGHLTRGKEFAVLVPLVLLGIYLSWLLAGGVETAFFAGDFKQWLFSALGVRYDQRNSMIIAIALGFAVIPIIFTIAEDALSNVPRNLTAASLALGASRWQTAWRVVLPSALPGVFSAVMIGFGRAIGETMIVLMATGNTPILSWSIFNGLRSLSANIAVEIPEAPLDGSLYRVLFLSAVLLFIFTFIINTVAEALRQRFRKKYGRY